MESIVKKVVRVIMAIAALLGSLQGAEVVTGVDLAPPYGGVQVSQSDIQSDWVNTGKAASLAGVSRSTIYSWCRSGRVKAAKDQSGRWRIDPSSLPRRGGEGR